MSTDKLRQIKTQREIEMKVSHMRESDLLKLLQDTVIRLEAAVERLEVLSAGGEEGKGAGKNSKRDSR